MNKIQSGSQSVKDRSQHFSVTAFNADIEKLKDIEKYPNYVKKVLGGVEICPTTGKEHFQAHIQLNRQMRFKTIKEWLPESHIEVSKNVEASKKYAMKFDTSAGEKKEFVNPERFYKHHELLLEIAKESLRMEREDPNGIIKYIDDAKGITDHCFSDITSEIISRNVKFVNYVNNQLMANWNRYYIVFRILALEDYEAECLSITHSAVPTEGGTIDEVDDDFNNIEIPAHNLFK